MKPDRNVIQQALKVAQSYEPEYPATKGLRDLASRGMGEIVANRYRVTRGNRKDIREWLGHQDIDWRMPAGGFSGDKIAAAGLAVNEKLGRPEGSTARVWVTALGEDVRLNGQTLPIIDGAYVSIAMNSMTDLQAAMVVLVENKAAFTGLYRVQGDFQRRGVLGVYRGDPTIPHGQLWARLVCTQYDIPLAAYCDFDPAGLDIALTSGARMALLPDLDALSELEGSPEDFRNQHIQWQRLRALGDTHPLGRHADHLGKTTHGFTQERLIAHGITHQWLSLDQGVSDGS